MSGPVTDVKFAGDHMGKEKKKSFFYSQVRKNYLATATQGVMMKAWGGSIILWDSFSASYVERGECERCLLKSNLTALNMWRLTKCAHNTSKSCIFSNAK